MVASGSVHSTTSRSPAASRVSALRVFSAGRGQRARAGRAWSRTSPQWTCPARVNVKGMLDLRRARASHKSAMNRRRSGFRAGADRARCSHASKSWRSRSRRARPRSPTRKAACSLRSRWCARRAGGRRSRCGTDGRCAPRRSRMPDPMRRCCSILRLYGSMPVPRCRPEPMRCCRPTP